MILKSKKYLAMFHLSNIGLYNLLNILKKKKIIYLTLTFNALSFSSAFFIDISRIPLSNFASVSSGLIPEGNGKDL